MPAKSQSMPAPQRAQMPSQASARHTNERLTGEEQVEPANHIQPEFEQYQETANLAGNLRAARGRARAALAHRERKEAESWAKYLLPAAQQLEEALSSFLEFEPVWRAMRKAERTTGLLDQSVADGVAFACDQDIAGLLEFLGYTQPPPSEEMARDVVNALSDVLEQQEAALAGCSARRAEYQLTLFVLRLRKCISEAGEEDSNKIVPPTVRQRLVTVVERAVVAAGPAVLAASVVAYTFPSTGLAFAGFGIAAQAGSKKMLEIGVTAATGGLLTRATANAVANAPPEELVEAAEVRLRSVARDLISALHVVRAPGSVEELIRLLAIETVSAAHALRSLVFQMVPAPSSHFLTDHIDNTVHALVDLREAIVEESDYEDESVRAEDRLVELIQALASDG